MTRLLLSTALCLASSVAVLAGDLPQAQSDWFKAGQAKIAERMTVAPITKPAKNVILFTADGNGVGTNYAIRLFSGQQAGGLGDDYVQPQETFPHVALVKTYSSNGQTPDSAPTAAAMNSGIKTKNGMINVLDTVNVGDCAAGATAGTKTFAEIVSDMGKSVGVLSTARITHATPAAVYARTVDRDWEDPSKMPEGCTQKDIAAQLIDQIKAGVIDVAMGGGRAHFLPKDVKDVEGKDGKRPDGRDLVAEAKALGAEVVFGEEDFTALDLSGKAPVLGLFESSHMKYETDRTGEPSLAEMTEAAIKALSTNENGFYLNIEGGRVDHANHDGNLYRTVTDGKAFADAIAVAMKMTNPEETLIIVTADHEHAISFNGYCGRGSNVLGLCMEENEQGVTHTGKPNLADDGKPYTVAGYLNGVGSVLVKQADGSFSGARPEVTEEQATDKDYIQQALVPMQSETHSGEDVAVYARGPWAHLFGGVIEQNVIFHVMNHAVKPE
ncbi:alkaline phosphatase [Rhodobacter capsulatus]|jgi:alkaline phosphatase|uniref:Alkaline phosphatase n=1 Tax=Rhodobacter capsulatus (strain ATCC BAA-309 / NBRC 16581 / SB1003) TaxID=272942 RepID=D5AKQ9_RHOCB|nr:alkaline phosphatase [Rhodobacter capsulatus]ADE83901.1 alkaline phosphatase [Rhodobacter capsulatus SB 1003]ETD03611.1 alkaline phosphatase [Rhodobacter capsulatus DE442]ETD80404.1 alkaline phosphatase [Rhodobacter capsulatus R121]ETE55671.1 alkaline phosphatase [Rhodobacter capsulatus Y262]MDS0925492.1 alkaline phosphatase [Rhodobacter capsulatus]